MFETDHLDREGPTSITQQLVDRVTAAIESGALAPGEKLPTTRALAQAAGVNHLTATRAYRRLAELGYVTAARGRGTFVRTLVPRAAESAGDDWQLAALPQERDRFASQVLGDSLRLAHEPGVISLSTGWPHPECLPAARIAEVAGEVFEHDAVAALSYIDPRGLPALRDEIAARGRVAGYASSAEEIIVTTGARQGLDLAARAIVGPGDVAVVESPTFIGMLSSLQNAGARVIGIPVDRDGLDVDALERVLARQEVRLCALQTACANPTGRDLSPERRERLARLAIEHNFLILEDGVYATLRIEGDDRPRLRSLAPSHVVYADSISKTVGGGLRLGWLAAQGPVLDRLASLKLDADIHTPAVTQLIAARYLNGDFHAQHLERSITFYRDRRDALMEALERHLPGEQDTDLPLGGHNAWVTLRRPLDDRLLYAEAVRHGVSFTPGATMQAERAALPSLRLSFSLSDPEELDEGVRRLARAIRALRRIERPSAAVAIS